MCLQLGQPAEAPCPECKYCLVFSTFSTCFVQVCICHCVLQLWGWLKLDWLPHKHPPCLTSFSKQPNDNQIIRMGGDSCVGISVFPLDESLIYSLHEEK